MNEHAVTQPQKIASPIKPTGPAGHTGLLQRKCACGGTAGLASQCSECDKKRLTLRRRSANQTEPSSIPPIVEQVLGSTGQPLDAEARELMESRLGHDFSQVRIHNDEQAAESARAVNAMAYTVGQQVVFASGKYQPRTSEGRRLLAHELTHVVQQGQGQLGTGGHFQGKLEIGSPDSSAEREADRAAEAVESETGAQPNRLPKPVGSSPVLQRKTGDAGSWMRGLFSSLVHDIFGFPDTWLQEYLEKLDKTGDIEGDPDSDDKAREIVNEWRKGGSKFVLTAQRKALLIHEMLDGPTIWGDEDAILELLERSYDFELMYIFGAGGVTPARLGEDVPDDQGDRLRSFYLRRFDGGWPSVMDGKFIPLGEAPVSLGVELPPIDQGMYEIETFKDGSTGWDVPCVLGILCAEDSAIVEQLQLLNVKKMERIDVKQWTFDGKSWSYEVVHPKGVNKPDEKLVGLIATSNCNSAAQTMFHEVHHQNQPEDVRKTHFTMEVDAYTETEKWAIKRGLPETGSIHDSLRSRDEKGVQTPNVKAIEGKVTRIYGGPTEEEDKEGEEEGEVKGHKEPNKTKLKLANDKEGERPSKKGDRYLEEPPTFVKETPLDPKGWVCPKSKKTVVQAKLAVDQPGDHFEDEADRIADQVMGLPDQITPMPEPHLQRQAGIAVGPGPTGFAPAPPIVQEVLHSHGQPLDESMRAFVESGFGHDFSRVRVHADARAAESARAVGALAYTVGRDVVFAEGQYAPGTSEGKRLLAHELTHVVQQGAGSRINETRQLVQRQTERPVLQRQPAPRKKLKILSLDEINADPARKKAHQWVGAPAEARVCRSTNLAPTSNNCPAKLAPGAEVNVIAGQAGAGWLQIENTGFAGFGDKEPCYILGVFAKELPAPAPAAPKPAPPPVTAPKEEPKPAPAQAAAPSEEACFDGTQIQVSKGGKSHTCTAITGTIGDPTPTGRFCIRPQGEAQVRGGLRGILLQDRTKWFLLEPQFATKRSRMQLHPGTLSAGCITVNDKECFDKLAEVLNQPGTVSAEGYDGYPPGNDENVNNPKKSVDCVGWLTVTSEGACKQPKTLQRHPASPDRQTDVPPLVREVLNSTGEPLEPATRRHMESRFGHDFSQVRVHTDRRAAESARTVNATAYTLNQDIVFGAGRYTPETPEGASLLAHELTHTIQQGPRSYSPADNLELSHPADAAEREADIASNTIGEAGPVTASPRAAQPNGVISREAATGLGGAVKSALETVRTATDYQNTYKYLNGLEVGVLLDKLKELKRLGYLDGLFENFELATGVHRERLFMAMKAVELQGKVKRDQFATLFVTQMEKIKEADQREKILSFLSQPAASATQQAAPAAASSTATPSASSFKTSAYQLESKQATTLVKAREANEKKKVTGRAEIKETPAAFAAEILQMAGLDANAWFSSFTSISFLGFQVSDIHTDLAAHLKQVEQKFADTYGGDQKDPVVAGKALGLKQNIGGARRAPTGTGLSMHLFGLAIDVNYDTNPWVGEESSLSAENKVFSRASMLVRGESAEFTPNKMTYDQIHSLNETMKTYFSYLDNRTLLETQLKDAKGTWTGKSADDAQKQIQADFDDMAVKWERTGTAKEKIKAGGFFDLKKEFVEGMGLDWGGKYGDMMHFDMRNKGNGAKVDSARNAYKSKKVKESEEKYAKEHSE